MLDQPPYSMSTDQEIGSGVSDVVLKLVMADWPATQQAHRRVVVTPSRALSELRRGDHVCANGIMWTPERGEAFYFAIAHLIPPLHVIARADAVDRIPLNRHGEVILDALLERRDLRAVFVESRSYGSRIGALLESRDSAPNVRRIASDSDSRIVRMLAADRADYSVDHDPSLRFAETRYPTLNLGEKLRSLPIEGAFSTRGGIACPRTAWGRAAAMRIDAILAKHATDPAFQGSLTRWLSPQARTHYQAEQDAFYRERRQPAPPPPEAPSSPRER